MADPVTPEECYREATGDYETPWPLVEGSFNDLFQDQQLERELLMFALHQQFPLKTADYINWPRRRGDQGKEG